MSEQLDDQAAVEALLADLAIDLEAVASETPSNDDDDWLTLPEAAREAGVSRSALRQWYRSGQIPSRLVEGPNGPQRLVPRTAVLTRAAFSPARPRARRDLEAEVADLRRRVGDLEAEVADLRRRVELLEQ